MSPNPDSGLAIAGLLAATLRGKRAPKPVARKRHLTRVLVRDRAGQPYIESQAGRRRAVVHEDGRVEYHAKATKSERKAVRKARKKATRSTLT